MLGKQNLLATHTAQTMGYDKTPRTKPRAKNCFGRNDQKIWQKVTA